MTRSIVVLFAFAISIVPNKLFAQVIVGNGGDLIFCRQTADQSISGWYFLDYVVSLDPGSDYLSGANPEQTIIENLSKKIPQIGQSLSRFVDSAKSQMNAGTDWNARDIWFSSNNGVATIRDEELDFLPSRFPNNCLTEEKALDLFQVVHHINRGDTQWYQYDPDHLKNVINLPLQYSHLLVHEWLWKFSKDAFMVRQTNQFLHTTDWLSMNSQTLHNALLAFGLDLSEFGPVQEQFMLDREDWRGFTPIQIPVDSFHGVKVMFFNKINKIVSLRINPMDFYVGVPRLGNVGPGPVENPIKTPVTLNSPQTISIGTRCRDIEDCSEWHDIIRIVPLPN